MKQIRTGGWLLVAVMLLSQGGCTFNQMVKRQYQKAKNTTRGEYYLETRAYRKGITVFTQEVARNPREPWANHYLGRYYLADDNDSMGLRYLTAASDLAPQNADFQFWAGVAHFANGNRQRERDAYRRVLAIDPDHPQALSYMGHNRLSAGKHLDALGYYRRCLAVWPTNPQALFNRALILKKLSRDPEAYQAWLAYLQQYPTGAFARKAVQHLISAGHFDYRNYRIGGRRITLDRIAFVPLTAELTPSARKTLARLGDIFRRQDGNRTLQILVYQQNNTRLAAQRADSIRTCLLARMPDIAPRRVRSSWFGVPETIRVGKKKFREGASVNFFTTR